MLLDSVQSQANRMEIALLAEWESGRAPLPVISVNFTKDDIPQPSPGHQPGSAPPHR